MQQADGNIKGLIMNKPIIYQILPRLWGNNTEKLQKRGSLEQNGTGKFNDIDSKTLEYIKWLGCSHVWFTGVIRHATKSNTCGCLPSHPQIVKGEAGSPYSIENYYDVNPYLATEPERRMAEFEELIERTHRAGLKAIIDFVPNHVSRDYGTVSHGSGDIMRGFSYLGSSDDSSRHWYTENDFFYYPDETLRLPNQDLYISECKSLSERDFAREYKVIPAWLADKCRVFCAGAERTEEEYREFLSGYESILHLFVEKPAKATGNNCYRPDPSLNDWYETIKINYTDEFCGTWEKMYRIVQYWASKGVDGFRCDMVELVPESFFKWLIRRIKSEFPDVIFIAEVYKKDLYRKYIREVGFDILYDKSGLYDTLRAVVEKNVSNDGMPVELWQSATGITRNWQFLGDLQPYMLDFLENHDEQRFASEFFGKDARNSFAALYVSLFLNRAPFMLYFGEEMGERGMDEEGFSGRDGRTTIFDWWSIGSVRALRRMIADGSYKDAASSSESGTSSSLDVFRRYSAALRFAAEDPAVRYGTVYDLCYCNYSSDGFDKDRHFAWLRDHGDETLLFVSNFSNMEANIDLLIPEHAFEWLGMEMTKDFNPQKHIKVKVPSMDGIWLRLC